MPNPGQVNNASGSNGSHENGTETPYGAIKRLTQMTRTVPLPTAPGTTAPQQAKRAAGKPQAQQEPAPATPDQPAMAEPTPYPAQMAQTWAALASVPGASPLVQMIAEEAQRGSQG